MDWSIFHAVNRFAVHTAWAHAIFKFYAGYGVVVFGLLIAFCAVVAVRSHDGRVLAGAVWAGAAAVIILAVNQPIADAVGRLRPYQAHPSIFTLVDRGTDPSFMSDHSVVAGAVAIGLVLVARRIGVVAIVAAVLMAFTRVYVGAHYPGDVAAGLAAGGLVAAAGWVGAQRLLVPFATKMLGLPILRRFAVSAAS